LETSPHIEVWSISRTGFPGLARPSQVLHAPIARAVKALGQPEPMEDPSEILEKTARRAALRDDLLEAFPESEAAWVRAISLYASTGKSMFLGNSMPIREWNLFAQDLRPVTKVRANRGANGIDGQLSTWLGWTADEDGAWTLVGDLTTLYDLAAPFILDQLVRQDRVIVVINNGGGKIFDRLPQLGEMQEKARQLMTNPHTTELAGWAQMWNMSYLAVRSLDDLDNLAPGDNCTVCEIFPDASQTADFWARWDRIS
jgi:2-succinyl-5-enolpyruvyl-6-hydroxy-3-cyclohexene-1-carboxylate synthase